MTLTSYLRAYQEGGIKARWKRIFGSTRLEYNVGKDQLWERAWAPTQEVSEFSFRRLETVQNSLLPVEAARSFGERGASAPCFPERGKASAISAGTETADRRPPLASDPKAISAGAAQFAEVPFRELAADLIGGDFTLTALLLEPDAWLLPETLGEQVTPPDRWRSGRCLAQVQTNTIRHRNSVTTSKSVKMSIESKITNIRIEDALLLYCARTMIEEETASQIKNLLRHNINWVYLIQSAIHHRVAPPAF